MTEDTDSFAYPGDSNKPRVVSMIEARPKSEVEKVGDELRKALEATCANVATVAKIRRVAYLAYVKEGFTPQEALELCCK